MATTETEDPVARVRRDRWDAAQRDVPDEYGSDELLRSIAADARRMRDDTRSIMVMSHVIAACAVICVVLAALVAFGGVTIVMETDTGF